MNSSYPHFCVGVYLFSANPDYPVGGYISIAADHR